MATDKWKELSRKLAAHLRHRRANDERFGWVAGSLEDSAIASADTMEREEFVPEPKPIILHCALKAMTEKKVRFSMERDFSVTGYVLQKGNEVQIIEKGACRNLTRPEFNALVHPTCIRSEGNSGDGRGVSRDQAGARHRKR